MVASADEPFVCLEGIKTQHLRKELDWKPDIYSERYNGAKRSACLILVRCLPLLGVE